MTLCVHLLDGPDAGLRRPLDRPLLIGRSPACAVVLADPDVAERHLRLTPVDGGVRVDALDGAVRHGDLRVHSAVAAPGAVLHIGQSALELCSAPRPRARERFGAVIGRSAPMQTLFGQLERVAPSELAVLLQGETGTGKELVARAIHRHSHRRHRPFVVIDCSAMPRDLIESTLFGHEKGAFTGAFNRHRGLFEQADGGTVFLDEIGELDAELQPRLLRVLERRELTRVGGGAVIRIDVRVIAATHRDLAAMVEAGAFREDLYFRIGGVHLRLPPLRDRRDDIPLLAEHLLAELAGDSPPSRLTAPALAALVERDWPGNVRELRNTLVRAVGLADRPLLEVEALMLDAVDRAPPSVSLPLDAPFKDARKAVLEHFEALYLEHLLAEHGGNISRSARRAGLTRYYLRELLKKHGLHGPQ